MKRGEIYLVDLGQGVGSVQRGKRPCLIIQNDIGNKNSNTVIIAPLTSKFKKNIPTHYKINTSDKAYMVKFNQTVLFEQIQTVDKKQVLHRIDTLNCKEIEEIDNYIKISLGVVI